MLKYTNEGYWKQILNVENINIDRINKQKESLISIYEKFFTNL